MAPAVQQVNRSIRNCWRGYCAAEFEVERFVPQADAGLQRVLDTYVDHYKRERPHRALGLVAPDPPCEVAPLSNGAPAQVCRRDRLGGLLHEYELAA